MPCSATCRTHADAAALEASLAELCERAPGEAELGANLLAAQSRATVLRRFLMATGDVDSALQMLLATLAWRKHNGVARALDANISEEAVTTLVERHRVLFAGFSKQGCPVYVDKSAATDWSAVLRVLTQEQVVWAHTQQNEFTQRVVLPYASRRAGRAITRYISVVDLRGLSMSSLSRRVLELLKSVSAIDQKHFPETVEMLYLVNPPSALSTLLRMLPLSPATRRKMVVLGSGAPMVAALREALGPDVHLPAAVLTGDSNCMQGVVDVGAVCFEYIADVERSLAAGGGAEGGVRRHAVLASLFGAPAPVEEHDGSGARLARRPTFTLVPAGIKDAQLAPVGRTHSVVSVAATVFHDSHESHELEEEEEDEQADEQAGGTVDSAAERERFYTQRMLAWVQGAAAAEAAEEAAGPPVEDAAPKKRAGCFACFR